MPKIGRKRADRVGFQIDAATDRTTKNTKKSKVAKVFGSALFFVFCVVQSVNLAFDLKPREETHKYGRGTEGDGTPMRGQRCIYSACRRVLCCKTVFPTRE
jgi:hypothetical protein